MQAKLGFSSLMGRNGRAQARWQTLYLFPRCPAEPLSPLPRGTSSLSSSKELSPLSAFPHAHASFT